MSLSTLRPDSGPIKNNVLEAIGNTPIVRLNKIGRDLPCELYVKLEFMNPGGSIKDRIGFWMIEDAEQKGLLKPGGTIVEGTSGNTGIGVAIAAAIKGYKCIFVLPDKMSIEKIKSLRAFGAKVVVTPTAVEADDPRSYYQVSRRLARETPNALYLNQYDNLSNRECHYATTGPEVLRQMPEIDAFISGIGTGGTVCGTGKYLKEHRPECKIIAIDPVGSIVYEMFKTGKAISKPKTYKIEGIGEDFIPKNYDFSLIDDIVQVEDKESFLMTRELLLKEGLYSGISSGSAVVGAIRWATSLGERARGKKFLIVLPDSGNRYLSKVYDDDWMQEVGFLEGSTLGHLSDLLAARGNSGPLIMAKQTDKVSSVIELLKSKGISQVPVSDAQGWIKGIVSEGGLLNALYTGKAKPTDIVELLVDSSIEFVTPEETVERISKLIAAGKTPLVTDPLQNGKPVAIITKIDLLTFMSNRT